MFSMPSFLPGYQLPSACKYKNNGANLLCIGDLTLFTKKNLSAGGVVQTDMSGIVRLADYHFRLPAFHVFNVFSHLSSSVTRLLLFVS